MATCAVFHSPNLFVATFPTRQTPAPVLGIFTTSNLGRWPADLRGAPHEILAPFSRRLDARRIGSTPD